MKKNDILQITLEDIEFPNKAYGFFNDTKIYVKNGIPLQKVNVQVIKKKHGNIEAKLIEVIEKSPLEQNPVCKHFEFCGGCTYQNLPYDRQLELKQNQVKRILSSLDIDYEYEFLEIEASPQQTEYRNKMEFSFGDEQKGGELSVGMRKQGSFYEVVNATECCIVDKDFRIILKAVLNYFRNSNSSFYHKGTHVGMLRYLIIRKSPKTQQIIVNLVTSSQIDKSISDFANLILGLNLNGEISGILHTVNDSVADVVRCDELKILYGKDYFMERILNLDFKVSAFSFFQTNSLGAEKLYSIVKQFLGDTNDKIVFDLYCGTGTISQIISDRCKKVIGIELIEEAVNVAVENAKLNKIENCEFIAGDVLKKVDEIHEKPDIIVLDPPRDGIHPKAIEKIIQFNADKIIYISCKPTSLVRDLNIFLNNEYRLEKVKCMDMFPHNFHVEVCVLMSRVEK